MAGETQETYLDRQVREWLESQPEAIRYRSVPEKDSVTEEAGGESFDADFLVLHPFPLAIVTMVGRNPRHLQMEAKRFLNQRISLAERYGRFLPVIVIVPEGIASDQVPYADGAFSVSELPSIGEIKARLKLDDDVQRILSDGDPGEVRFSEVETVHDLWSRSLSLFELADAEAVFPEGSLAQRLNQVLPPLREEIEANVRPGVDQNEAGHQSIQPEVLSRRFGRTLPWYARSRRFMDEFDRVLHDFITELCGGTIETNRIRSPGLRGWISAHVWKSPSGLEVVLRRLMGSHAGMQHKTQQLVAEAWITRVFIKGRVETQLLLLGSAGEEPREVKTILGVKKNREQSRPIEIQQVNLLEGAGWDVCPWDFGNSEPRFIKRLKEVAHDS